MTKRKAAGDHSADPVQAAKPSASVAKDDQAIDGVEGVIKEETTEVQASPDRSEGSDPEERCPRCPSHVERPASAEAGENVSWLACDRCKTWYHASCVSLNPKTVVRYVCQACEAAPGANPNDKTVLREERPKRQRLDVDYTALNGGERVNNSRHAYTGLIESRPFATKQVVELVDGVSLTKEYIDRHGFDKPIVIHNKAGLGLQIPEDLTVDQVADSVGRDEPIEVLDVPTQADCRGWDLGRWADYYNEETPARVRNVISLEISHSELGKQMQRPALVDGLDVVDAYWPRRRFAQRDIPKVQMYCLMSLTNSYTDFHVDFAGTSVYYHIIRGKKTFLFIPPTPANLNKYRDWCSSSTQSTTFLADSSKETFKVDLSAGDTMMIPSSWIHAVHTPEKSLVIGGNFLSLVGMRKHLGVIDIEDRTKVPLKFRFPQFQRLVWYVAIGVLTRDEAHSEEERGGLFALAQYVFKQACHADGKAVDEDAKTPTKQDVEEARDGIPKDMIRGSSLLLAKLFVRHALARLSGDEREKIDATNYELTKLEHSAEVLVLADIAETAWKEIKVENRTDSAAVTVGESITHEQWHCLTASKVDGKPIGSRYRRLPDEDARKQQRQKAAQQQQQQKAEQQKQNASVSNGGTHASSPTSVETRDEAEQSDDATLTSSESGDNDTDPMDIDDVSLHALNHPPTAIKTDPSAPTRALDDIYANSTYLPPLDLAAAFSDSFSMFPPLPHTQGEHLAECTDGSQPRAAWEMQIGCMRCKAKRKKCDKEQPCSSCIEDGVTDECASFMPAAGANKTALESIALQAQQALSAISSKSAAAAKNANGGITVVGRSGQPFDPTVQLGHPLQASASAVAAALSNSALAGLPAAAMGMPGLAVPLVGGANAAATAAAAAKLSPGLPIGTNGAANGAAATKDSANGTANSGKPRKQKQYGRRCLRCTKDKKPCNLSKPCDRCTKKGLGKDECVYQWELDGCDGPPPLPASKLDKDKKAASSASISGSSDDDKEKSSVNGKSVSPAPALLKALTSESAASDDAGDEEITDGVLPPIVADGDKAAVSTASVKASKANGTSPAQAATAMPTASSTTTATKAVKTATPTKSAASKASAAKASGTPATVTAASTALPSPATAGANGNPAMAAMPSPMKLVATQL